MFVTIVLEDEDVDTGYVLTAILIPIAMAGVIAIFIVFAVTIGVITVDGLHNNSHSVSDIIQGH